MAPSCLSKLCARASENEATGLTFALATPSLSEGPQGLSKVLETPEDGDECLEGVGVRMLERLRDCVLRCLDRRDVRVLLFFANLVVAFGLVTWGCVLVYSLLGLFLSVNNGWNEYYPECVALAELYNQTLTPKYIPEPPGVEWGWAVTFEGPDHCTLNQFYFNSAVKAFTVIFTYVNGIKIPWRLSILHHAWCSSRFRKSMLVEGTENERRGYDFYGRETDLSRFKFTKGKGRIISVLENLAVIFHMLSLLGHLQYRSYLAGQTWPGAAMQNVPFVLSILCMVAGGIVEMRAHNAIKPKSRWICGCLSNAIISLVATVYLILGLAITFAALALFFTPYQRVLPPRWHSYGLMAGVATIAVGVLGILASCERRNEKGVHAGCLRLLLLWIFTLLHLLLLGGLGFSLVAYWHFEDLLGFVASRTELDFEGSALDLDEERSLVSNSTTSFVRTLATNAFDACAGAISELGAAPTATASNTITASASEPGSGDGFVEIASFGFRCTNRHFVSLGQLFDQKCFAASPVNATLGSAFHTCYMGERFRSWPPPRPLPPHTLAQSLETPKGIFCACAATFLEGYILTQMEWFKVAVLILLVVLAMGVVVSVHQIAQRTCGSASWWHLPKDDLPAEVELTKSPMPSRGASVATPNNRPTDPRAPLNFAYRDSIPNASRGVSVASRGMSVASRGVSVATLGGRPTDPRVPLNFMYRENSAAV